MAPPGVTPSGTTEVDDVSLGLLGLPFTGGAPLVLQMVRDAMVAQPPGNVRGGAKARTAASRARPPLTERCQDSTVRYCGER